MNMHRRLTAIILAICAFGPIPAGHVGTASAAGGGCDSSLPVGAVMLSCAEWNSDSLGAFKLNFDLVDVAPGSAIAVENRLSGAELLYEESGQADVFDGCANQDRAFNAGDKLFFGGCITYGFRNDSTEPAKILRVGVHSGQFAGPNRPPSLLVSVR